MISEQILSALPSQSRDKLEQFIDDKDAAYAAYCAASDNVNKAQTDLVYHQHMANRQLEGGQGVEYSYPGTAIVNKEKIKAEKEELTIRIMAPVEAAKRRVQKAVEARDRAADKVHEFAFLENTIDWLERTIRYGENFTAAYYEKPKSRNIMIDLSKARDRLEALGSEWLKVENAPLPAKELEARMFAEIDTIAERGVPSFSPTNRSDEPLGLRQKIALDTRPGRDGSTFVIGNAGAPLFVWLMQDELKKKVSDLISGRDFQYALSDEGQDKEFTRITNERLDLERHEEALICQALAEGLLVVRRRDADPRAILGIDA